MQGVGAGKVIGDRYTLGERRAHWGPLEVWTGADGSLQRQVSLTLFPSNAPRAAEIVDSARRAAGFNDHRMIRVWDVGRNNDISWIVEEPLGDSQSLAQLLHQGALPPEEARRITGEAASALEAAAGRGLHHLRLDPHAVRRTHRGNLRIAGLAIAATIEGVDEPDGAKASAADALSLIGLLYTMLTTRWPLGRVVGLDSAPKVGAYVVEPAQIASNIPDDLNQLCRDVLTGKRRVSTPGEVAALLGRWSPLPIDLDAPAPAPAAPAPATAAPATVGSATKSAPAVGTPSAAPQQKASGAGPQQKAPTAAATTSSSTNCPATPPRPASGGSAQPAAAAGAGATAAAGAAARTMSAGAPSVPAASSPGSTTAPGATSAGPTSASAGAPKSADPSASGTTPAPGSDGKTSPGSDGRASTGIPGKAAPGSDGKTSPGSDGKAPPGTASKTATPSPPTKNPAQPARPGMAQSADPATVASGATASTSAKATRSDQPQAAATGGTSPDAPAPSSPSTDPSVMGTPDVVPASVLSTAVSEVGSRLSGVSSGASKAKAALRAKLDASKAAKQEKQTAALARERAQAVARAAEESWRTQQQTVPAAHSAAPHSQSTDTSPLTMSLHPDTASPSTGSLEQIVPLIPLSASTRVPREQVKPLLLGLAAFLLVALSVSMSVLMWGAGDQVPHKTQNLPVSMQTSPGAKPNDPAQPNTAGPIIEAATGFDPEGDRDENGGAASKAHDGNPETFWKSESYVGPGFADKSGVGVVFSLAKEVPVSKVALQFPVTGQDVEIWLSDDNNSIDKAKKVGSKQNCGSVEEFVIAQGTAPKRHIVVFFTKGVESDGKISARLSEIKVS